MSLINTGCILIQKADSDAYVKYQDSVLEVKRGRLEIALSPGPRVICGTRSLSVSGILPERVSCLSRINLTVLADKVQGPGNTRGRCKGLYPGPALICSMYRR